MKILFSLASLLLCLNACASGVGRRDLVAQTKKIDSITNFENVIENQDLRGLYQFESTHTSDEERVYTFTLKPQSGMKAMRHHQTLVIKWLGAQAGQPHDRKFEKPSALSGGVPNGGTVIEEFWTRDRRWRVLISESSLLPNSTKSAGFHLRTLGEKLVKLYDEAR